jgi:hypothetical protein
LDFDNQDEKPITDSDCDTDSDSDTDPDLDGFWLTAES